mgnify:CR=1 FL=1
MLRRNEAQKIRRQKERWNKAMLPVEKFLKEVKNIIKEEKNKMMYGKKETNRIDRYAYELVWWFKLVIIFMAFSYIFGR